MGEFRRGGEEDVAGAVQRRFAGVLQDADDEADADDLHGDVVVDAEGGAGHRDQQQGTAGHAGRSAGAYGRDDREQERRRHIDLNSQRIRRRQRQHRNRDGSARHVDGRAQRNRDRVDVRVQPETRAEAHIDRDVRSGAAGEERVDAAFPECREDQRVRVFMGFQEHDQRIHDQRDGEERAEQHHEQPCVAEERVKAAFADGFRHKPHDAEGSEADDPLDDFRHAFGDFRDKSLRRRRRIAHCNAEQHRPREDADIVCFDDGVHRIVHDGNQQVSQHLHDAAGRREVRVGNGKPQLRREQERGRDGDQRGAEGADHVKLNDRAHGRAAGGSIPCHRVADKDKDKNRRNALQGADEQLAENREDRDCLRRKDRQRDTDDESARNQPDQRLFKIPGCQ